MELKHSVKFQSTSMAMAFALQVVSDAFRDKAIPLVITSVNDGTHMATSLHYKNAAFDIRSKHIADSAMKHRILGVMRSNLTEDFDVILEQEGKPNEHYHLEFQPR